MRILIVGDSFAADWQKKYPDRSGWPNLLAKTHTVDNLAQAGCSEYRIYKQLKSAKLDQYDAVIVSHTSPYRIYTEYHPDRCNDILHHSCDLLYSDTKNLAKIKPEYESAVGYFEKFFSLEYAEFCYYATIDKIKELLLDHKTIHLSHIVSIVGTDYIDFSVLFKKHQGVMNHYNDKGNISIYNKLLKELNK